MPGQFPLAEQVDGMSVLRVKGGASGKGLQLLKNGWITSARTMQARPGSVLDRVMPPGTHGVIGFSDMLHTFSEAPVAHSDPMVDVDILLHPTGGSAAIKEIHESFVFLGRLYVVAEFDDGVVQHYYLEDPAAWTAETAMQEGQVIQPTVPNGYYYENLTASTVPAWQSNVVVAAPESRQPTTANGLRYQVVATTGNPPAYTGNTEPTWPLVVGGQVVERRYITDTVQTPPGSSTPAPGTGGNTGIGEEYAPFPPNGGNGRTDDRLPQ